MTAWRGSILRLRSRSIRDHVSRMRFQRTDSAASRRHSATRGVLACLEKIQSDERLIAGTRNQRNQIPQNPNLNHSHDGPALVASEFNIVALDDQHDAATALHAR